MKDITKEIKKLKLYELEELKSDIENEIIKKENEEKTNKILPKEEILKLFYHFGYEIPPRTKFYKIYAPGKSMGAYGMKVGEFVHSCHIDTTDLIVLLVIDEKKTDHYVEDFADHWIKELFTT